ncbi:hypothetical protein Lgee_0809 [Legionella geestiana]|uniref:Thoeris protein ThsB TIR-like domain-containing protein n=1 Tax=Legionella geestiana TaxID=45065 RepID=A0A0W0U321_9GAMM|nr:TIR domain-containing protein [Legionella geestiana]KTD01947.1 hypothetical protein Lgee_0809 [Legionella geestiana]QBS12885.1 hypothetical protein E4T54_09095 [Legionella geestiana]QDQ39424.1 hypothetical protein E3226_002925 [Legionella geestiana]STX54625.1 MTH538 TIR-like domain (DUF1863) [Legionella geestiana]
MAYRNGTYVVFHAQNTSDPTKSDMKYYRLLTAWHEHSDIEFKMINSHDKTSAVRDSSKRATLQSRIRERLNNSRNMLLIIGSTTHLDDDNVPFEISYAVDKCGIPIIAAYTGYDSICTPSRLRYLWPNALAARINNNTAKVIHVPFRKEPIKAALQKYDYQDPPKGSLVHYTQETFRKWGLLQPS